MKRVFIYLIIVASAATIGTGVGFAGKKLFGPVNNIYDTSGLKIDAAQIVKKIDSYTGSKEKVDAFSTGEVLNYAMEKFRTCENCCSFTFGVANAKAPIVGNVPQAIRSCLIKNNDKYFEESISKSSMVSLANRMFQSGIESNVDFYSSVGSIDILDNGASSEYSESSVEEYSSNAYKEKFGKTLDEMFIYFISDDTILNSNIEKNDNGYVINVELDPISSTANYKNQMYNISGLSGLPEFKNVNLAFTLSKELKLNKLSINENYTAKKLGIDADTNGVIDIYYYSDEYIKIPELNESVQYKKGE